MRTAMKSSEIFRLGMLNWVAIAAASQLNMHGALAGTTRFVDSRATGANNGSSWTNAFVDLQPALAISQSGDSIWVAEGIYRPSVPDASQRPTFRLKPGVTLLGGFAGNEADSQTRQIELHATTLSGDLNGNDDPNGGNNSDNSYHVVTIQGGTPTTVLDGFVVAAGNANSVSPQNVGGGLFIVGGQPTFRSCIIQANSAFIGGGAYVQQAQPTFANCTFARNFAFAGAGALYVYKSAPHITGTSFYRNVAGSYGAAIYSSDVSSLVLDGCTFTENRANSRGGGLYVDTLGKLTMTYCTFTENSASEGGGIYSLSDQPFVLNSNFDSNTAVQAGGGINLLHSGAVIQDCTFDRNTANSGGAISAVGESPLAGSPTLTRCMISGNSASANGGGVSTTDNRTTVSGCVFDSNSADDGAGLSDVNGSITIHDSHFVRNVATFSGGGVSTTKGSPRIIRCEFESNAVLSSAGDGGGIWNHGSTAYVANCAFRRNGPSTRGAGVSNQDANPIFVNCSFIGNNGSYGGAVFNGSSSTKLINCTLARNSATSGGGVFSFSSVNVNIINSILWENTDASGGGLGAQNSNMQGSATVRNSCLSGWSSVAGGSGNIASDPSFVDLDGADDVLGTSDDNIRLGPASPCADAGDNSAVPADEVDIDGDGDVAEPLPLDLSLNLRFRDDPLAVDRGVGNFPFVDMGALEHESPVRFVATTAQGAGSGRNWQDAYTRLQDALAEAAQSPDDVSQIWVAEGTYIPALAGGIRTATFSLLNRVEIYGGYAGNETSRSQRNPVLHPTILSGDLHSDDGPNFQGYADNAYHVVSALGIDQSAVLDGFTISGGNADLPCTQCFGSGGGGMIMINASPRIRGCIFARNRGSTGGAMVVNGLRPSISNCQFVQNEAFQDTSHIAGGAIALNGTFADFTNCILVGNHADGDGGAALLNRSSPTFTNCIFNGNESMSTHREGGGGGLYALSSSPTLVNCTLVHNVTDGTGGAIFNAQASSTVIFNSILWANSDSSGQLESSQIYVGSGVPAISFTCIQGWTGLLGGLGNFGVDPRFVNAWGLDAVPGTMDDDFHLLTDSPCIDAGNNAKLLADIADLDDDRDLVEPTPFDLDGLRRVVDDPNVASQMFGLGPIVDLGSFEYQPDCDGDGIPNDIEIANCSPTDLTCHDCNENHVPDGCDDDCDGNHVPDECQVPQFGSIVSHWIGGAGFWSAPTPNINWCLPETPDNRADAQFDAIVSGAKSTVVLNSSPTVSSLVIEDGASVVVGDGSGANIRTLSVDEEIINAGVLRATDRERLVINALTIDQRGECGLGGLLEATDGAVHQDDGEDKSILEINGSRVLGGRVQTVGTSSEVHLIGGAELIDVCVSGAVVPDGQTGRFGGHVTNNDVLKVEGGALTTRLEPADNATLAGTGCVRLTSQSFARLGDFKTSFTNGTDHHLEGAGILFGGIKNYGMVRANHASEQLILSAPGLKINDGIFSATAGGTLRIADDVQGNGAYVADGGTILLMSGGESLSIHGDTLTVRGNSPEDGGAMDARGDTSSTFAGEVSIEQFGCLLLSNSTSMSIEGDLRVASLCHLPTYVQVAGGHTPPVTRVVDNAIVELTGSLVLTNDANSHVSSTGAFAVGGDFDNQSVAADCFDWIGATLLLNGDEQQNFEAAGEDRGPTLLGYDSNFGIGVLKLANHAEVVVSDAFDNQGTGVTFQSGREALYVKTLILEPESQISAATGKLYFCELVNLGGTVTGLGTNVLRILADADCDNDVDLDDFAALNECLAQPPSQPCLDRFDSDRDLDIDLIDVAVFLTGFTGP